MLFIVYLQSFLHFHNCKPSTAIRDTIEFDVIISYHMVINNYLQDKKNGFI